MFVVLFTRKTLRIFGVAFSQKSKKKKYAKSVLKSIDCLGNVAKITMEDAPSKKKRRVLI